MDAGHSRAILSNVRGAQAVTIHYHGTPITPIGKFMELVGCHFCVSYAAPGDIKRAHQYGQSVLLDNGAFSFWKTGKRTDWPGYYEWCDKWLNHPTTWAIIPDIIDGEAHEQAKLISQWPHGTRGAPVWHLHEGIERLLRLLDEWPKVCFGSSGRYAEVLSMAWCRRVDEAWNEIVKRHQRTPWVHMLRGMQCVKREWPFASVDSTDVARNHNREQNEPEEMARRWDQMQCPPTWLSREQLWLEGGTCGREGVMP
jgi:hypothetical protein